MEFSKSYNREEFLNFLRRDFLPDDFSQVNEPVVFATKTTYSKQATKLGVCKSLDLVVYEIKHSGKDDPRVGLSKEAFRMLSEEWQSRALVLFVPETNGNNYRFSLIEIKLEGDQTSAKVHRKYSNPSRYSYLLGEGIGGYTPNKYLAKGKIRENDEKDLLDRFSVEVLTKAFYNELSDWYAWAIDSVEFPGMRVIEEADKKNEHKSKNVIRLLTRLLFVWFLKQKRLIPDELFDVEYLAKNLLKNFNPHLQSGLFKEKSIDSIYYKAILQNLFFATLNCPIIPQSSEDKRERGFRKMDNWGQNFGHDHLMRYEKYFSNSAHFLELVNERVPFLNGGLFDCLDDKEHKVYIDGFSDNLIKPNQLIVPDYLFFGEVEGKGRDVSGFYGDKKKSKTDILGLIDILKKYNFTIEENMPFDQEVSLDPELLGKVFENLLASYNPETKTTARKQTGSFYTPREIVQYMVDESLVAHLKRTVSEELEEKYRKLMQYTDEDLQLTDTQKSDIIRSLQNCRVLDPACGSGAFPVGVLQQMVHILSQLDPRNEIWKDLILEESVRELGSTLRDCTDEERKEAQDDINRNFDDSINRPDYARKLYLIEKCIYGVDIQSIAVQISKLRFFISLVVDQKPTSDRSDNFGIRPLPNLEAKFVAANTLIGLKKEKNLFDNRDIDKLQNKLTQASHRIFGAKSNKSKNRWKERVIELQTKIAEQLEVLSVVSPEDAKLMRGWKMFDQNASSPFFDPEWMFGVSDGFDIVIANPPYVFTRDVEFSGDFKKYIEKEYFSKVIKEDKKSKANQSGKINLFAVFVMKGALLNSKGGVLTYIVPNNILRTTTYDVVRKFVLDNTTINQIVDLGSNVFDNVTASTVILQLLNIVDSTKKIRAITNVKDIKQREFETSNIPQNQFLSNTSYAFNIFGDDVVNLTLKKIESVHSKLGEKCVYISPGIDGDKSKYVSNYAVNTKYKPLLYGKNIKRYSINFDDNYILYDKKLLNRSRAEVIYQSPKIITQRISGGEKPIVAAIDREQYYTFNSVNNIVLKDNSIGLNVVVALLNSNVLNWYYANNFSNNSKLTVNISKTYLEMLPIPNIPNDDKKLIDELVEKVMEAKAISSEFSELETEIDLMVYKLYGLTYDEVLTIDPKTSITQQQYEDK